MVLHSFARHFGTVRVFQQKFTFEDAIELHAFAPLEANMRVTNGILLGIPLLLPVGTVNSVQTLKVLIICVVVCACYPICYYCSKNECLGKKFQCWYCLGCCYTCCWQPANTPSKDSMAPR
jgi:hypothetical protein